MNGETLKWRRMKSIDEFHAETLLRENENDCVSACGRFLTREYPRDNVWVLSEKDKKVSALVINSRSTLIPVLCGRKEIPPVKFLDGFLSAKKIHSVQGLNDEVIIMQKALEKTGRFPIDIIDYELMTLDKLPVIKNTGPLGALKLRVPTMSDLDALSPLQAGYEKEEVLPKGSVFSPAASRVNIANIIARGQILAAELNGKLVGKINVSAVSFTRYQIGGVYVHPDLRSKGIARAMTEAFITPLVKEGKGITLFVKKENLAARKLYMGLGFSIRSDYRITYY